MRRILLSLIVICQATMAQIPQVYLKGDFGNDYTEGSLVIQDANGQSSEYKVKAKWRGAYAKGFDKKSFAIKLIDDNGESLDASILGMREDNNWILDAMAVDKARMRNRVSFDLWNDFASDTYIKKDYDEEKSFNGTHGTFVELTLNDDYHGLYCLTEKIDRKQLKLKKMKKGVVHGVLYKASDWTGTMFYDYEDFDNSSPTWMGWEAKYPEVDDEGTAYYEPLSEAIKFVKESSSEDFASQAASYFDLPVWMDYFIFINLINAVDNEGKNTFSYVYDIEKERKMGIAPWDLDATWGRSYDGSEWGEQSTRFSHNLSQRLLSEYPNFKEDISARYFELRKSFFEASSLKNRFSAYYDYLNGCGTLERETNRWNGINGIELNFEQEQSFIDEWIDQRLDYLDQYFAELSTGILTPQVTKDNIKEYYYDLQGRRIIGIPKVKGFYIYEGKKIIVKN